MTHSNSTPAAAALLPTALALTIAENSTQGLAVIDERGYCIYANRAWLEMTGYDAEEIRARPLHELVHHHHPDGRPYPMQDCPIAQALPRNASLRSHEDLFFRKDGSRFEVACSVSPVYREGRPVGTVLEIRDVTRQKQAERELLESRRQALEAAQRAERERARLDAILAAAPVGIMMADAHGRLLEANPANERIWGKEPPMSSSVEGYAEYRGWWADGSERHGQPLRPTDWAMARALRGESTGAPDIVEIEPFGEPGVRRIIANHGSPIRGPEGEVIGAVIAQTDITARLQAEQALRENEARLRLALDAAELGTWRWEVASGTDEQEWDARCRELFGLAPGAPVRYETWASALPEDDRALVETALRRALDPAHPVDDLACDYRIRRPDGTLRWVSVLGRAFFEADPAAVGGRRVMRVLGTIRDVTQRRQAEAAQLALQAERDQATQLLRAFADAVPGVVYAKDREGRMLVANRGTTELIGQPPELYLGKTDREFLDDPAQAEAVMANDRRIMDGGVAEQLEEVVTPPGGEPTVWLSTKAPFRDAEGHVIGIIGASMDITARKAAEDALAEALRAKDALLYEVNHRVKNNLQLVSSLLSLQLRTLQDDNARNAIEEARMRVAVMAGLHRELYQSGRHGSVDMGPWAKRLALDTFKLCGAGGRIALDFEAPAELPMPVDRAVPLSLVLSELLTNALKYAFPEGRRGRIALRFSCEGERLRMLMRDDGQGLPAGFDAQASAGLGLRIMQALLHQLEGRLTLTAADPGTAVLVEVPLRDPAAG